MAKVIGYRELNFNNDDGEHVEGFTFWLSDQSEGVVGHEPVKLFVPPLGGREFLAVFKNPAECVGIEVEVVRNLKGKVRGLRAV